MSELSDGKYILLTTFRRNGNAVPTAVWFAEDGDRLMVWTARDSGKVKRIRRSGQVQLTACDMRGKPRGESVPARATLLDESGSAHTRSLIKRKYGILGSLTIFGSTLRRGHSGTVGIALTLDRPATPPAQF